MADTLERTFTFVKTGTGDTVAMWERVGTKYTSSPTLAYNYFAIWHSHQDEGIANRNQCFDGGDIYKLYYHVLNNETVNVSIITTHDYIYAAVITDRISFDNYIRGLCGSRDVYAIADQLDTFFDSGTKNCQGLCSFQKKTELGTLAITGNNSQGSGIKIYKSPRNNISFTLLTQ